MHRKVVVGLLAGIAAGAPGAAQAAVIDLPGGAARVLVGSDSTGAVGGDVSGAGDFNADGRPDWIVGGIGSDIAAWIAFGGSDPRTLIATATTMEGPGFTIRGGGGYNVSDAGDFNGDGISDVVVGSRVKSEQAITDNAVTVVFGRKGAKGAVNLDAAEPGQALKITGLRASSLARAGDVNGDGLSDIVVGNQYAGDGRGAAAVVLGRRETADVTLSQPGSGAFLLVGKNGPPQNQPDRPGDAVGSDVAPGGDIDGDGLDDIIVGARGVGGGPYEARDGAVFVVLGSRTFSGLILDPVALDPARGFAIRAPSASYGNLGAAVAGLGDVTGDGRPDVAVAAPDFAPSYSGRLWIVRGGRRDGPVQVTDPAAVAMDVPGPATAGTNYEFFGRGLAALGDVNGDGRGDLAVGASATPRRVYVIHVTDGGRVGFDADRNIVPEAGHTITTPDGSKADRFGLALGAVDGSVLIGSPTAGPGELDGAHLVALRSPAARPPLPALLSFERLALKSRTFRPGAGAGTTLRFRLSAPARVRMSISRAATRRICDATRGPIVLRVCVPQLTPVARLDLGKRGIRTTDVAFTGKIGSSGGRARYLAPGKYLARVQATSGERISAVRTFGFTVG